MKYIMAEALIGNTRRKIPCIFPSSLVHKQVAQEFTYTLVRHGYHSVQIVSAGELNMFGAGVECSGHSESLGIAAQEGDGKVIEMYDYLHGM